MKKGLFSLTNISLRKKRELDKVYREGKRLFFNYYSVFFVSAKDKRVAFSVPADSGTAVYRNRRRRLLREYFRKNITSLPSIHCVFNLIRKPESEDLEKEEIEKIIKCLKSKKF